LFKLFYHWSNIRPSKVDYVGDVGKRVVLFYLDKQFVKLISTEQNSITNVESD